MNTTPKGKIGRLPKHIQEQVNQRLEQGEPGRSLAAWLNSLPEVQALLAAEFAAKPIRQQNLSTWRHHGYHAWLCQKQSQALVQQLIAEDNELQPPGTPRLSDRMAGWITVRFLVAARTLSENMAGSPSNLKLLRQFAHDLIALRRGDHSAARLALEQERLHRRLQVLKRPEKVPLPPEPAKI
jgi:hypothetical protein